MPLVAAVLVAEVNVGGPGINAVLAGRRDEAAAAAAAEGDEVHVELRCLTAVTAALIIILRIVGWIDCGATK